MRALLLLLFVVAAGRAEDRWFVATLSGQPLASMRQSDRPLPGGGSESSTETLLVIRRSMPGRPELRFAVRETSVTREDAAGTIIDFRIDRDENGTITSASGTVAGRAVRGTLSRLGRVEPITIDLASGVELVGDQRSQRLLLAGATSFSGLALLTGQVAVVTSTVTPRGREGELRLFDVLADAMPIPMRLRLTAAGDLAGMSTRLGALVLDLKPSDGPVALLGGELPPTGLVRAAGPPPRRDRPNRIRLPPGAPLPENPFQHEADGVVELTNDAGGSAPAPGEFLTAGPQLELDDPDLRTWVQGIIRHDAGDAERLRLAVRSRIDKKDLMKGDASALETFRTRTGDCTEHAALLCAALRIAGIPSRIEVGLVFAPDYGGWVGHAWNRAWIDGRWVHLDSAYPGIPRCCYLALGYADGGRAGAELIVQLDRFVGGVLRVEE